MSKLVIESGIDIDSNPPTGAGFIDLECGKFRIYNSDTITVQASGSADKRDSYVTAHAIQITTPLPPPVPPLPPTDSEIDYYYQAGFSTVDGGNTIYTQNQIIPINFGNTVILSNDVNVVDIIGDGSIFEVNTPGTYHIRVKIPINTTNNLPIAVLTHNDVSITYSVAIAGGVMIDIDCTITLAVGDRISVINPSILNMTVNGTFTGVRLYSSILFELL